MPISLDEFVRSLTDTGILPPEELTSLVTSLPEDQSAVDVSKLAKDLVRQQKLTRFQASAIFKRQSRGLRFGDYVVLDKLGSGGMGQVFKAENRRTGDAVALKLLRATYSKSKKAITRFYREAGTAARLKHPNLVSVAEAGEWNGLHFLVMELIDGRDMRSIVKDQGPLAAPMAVDVILQAARGLEYAHQNGIVHRDVKPANLLLDRTGRLVILDLGLARLDETALEDDAEDRGRLTMPGNFLGTVDYISPEQTADAHEVDARSDVYSLGCTLYYLLCGQPPYRRDNPALILFAHCQDPIPSLLQEVPGIPPQLDALFQRMLAKKPDDRVTVPELIAALEACQAELGGTPTARPADRIAEPASPIGPTAPSGATGKTCASQESPTSPHSLATTISRSAEGASPGSMPPNPAAAILEWDRDEATDSGNASPPEPMPAPASPLVSRDIRFWLKVSAVAIGSALLVAAGWLAAGWVAYLLRR